MKIINLTPHELNIHVGDTIISIPPTLPPARRVETWVDAPSVAGIPVKRKNYGALTGLPDPQPDTIFIVSLAAAQAVEGRDDVYIPGEAVRDETGRIIGCVGLAKL